MGKRLVVPFIVVLALMSFGASGAAAASGSPLPISSGSPEYPSIAVEGGGDAVAAWAAKGNPGHDVVRWCVVPVGGGACSAGGSLVPAGGGQTYVYDTEVLVDGSTVAILADTDVAGTEYEIVQEWQSTDGGQTFHAVNGGKAVASGNTSNITHLLGAVTLPGGTSLGAGFVTPVEAPTFHAFSLASPTLCGRAENPTDCQSGYATLASGSDPDQVGNLPGNFAADGKGVLGVFRTQSTSGNFGCAGGSPFGMAFVHGTGLQGPSNDYNLSPGTANSAWRNRVTLADCGVDYIAAGGGPSGFGVLEDNQLTGQTQYHRFDEASGKFDTAPVVVSAAGEQQPSVSQDGAGGVYATYLSGGIGGPISLSYSSDGGASWTGPGTLAADPLGAVADLTSAVDPIGQGWAAWTENGSVFVQQFDASDAGAAAPVIPPTSPTPAPAPSPSGGAKASTTITTSQTAGAQTGASIAVPAGTSGETDRATIVGANAARATGTVTYTLYSSPTCSPASTIAQSTKSVSGASAPSSSPVSVVLAPGTYYWTAAYGGDSENGASSSGCGSEVLTVQSPNAIAAAATSDGKTLTFGASCAKVPCDLQVTASAGTTAATASSRTDRKARSATLGTAKFRIAKKGTQKLTLELSGAGRHFLAGKRKAKVSLVVTEKVGGHDVVTRRTLSVKVTHRKRSKR